MRAFRNRQKAMQTPNHCLIQDVSTRWNSTYFMIERLLEQRWPLTAVLSDSSATKQSNRYLDPKTEQWDLLDALKSVLPSSLGSYDLPECRIQCISVSNDAGFVLPSEITTA